MFGCATVVKVPDTLVAWIVPVTLKLARPAKFVIFAVVELITFDAIVPDTLKLLNWPKAVILVCVPLDNAPLNVPPSITPDTDKLLN